MPLMEIFSEGTTTLFIKNFIGTMFCLFLMLNIYSVHANQNVNNNLELSKGWKFCPVDSYQDGMDISLLNCYDIDLPIGWESVIPDYDGFGLLYNRFYMPQSFANETLAFYTSPIRDADKVFINDRLIGATGEFPPNYEKAVFYSRLYSIPLNTLAFDDYNLIKIWVYNGARPGGIINGYPKIGNFETLIHRQYSKNYITLAFMIFLLVFSLFNFINLVFNFKSSENLYYGLFLLAWALYLFSSSDLVLETSISLNLLFRFNVLLFFVIFSTFLLFIYGFFKQTIPTVVKATIIISLLFIPVTVLLPQLKHLYYLVSTVEVLALPILLYTIALLFRVTKERLPYARIMSFVLILYILFGFAEIVLDYVTANEASKYSPLGPWVLLVVSLVLTFIVGHKNMAYYRKATFDGLTGVLRFENFAERLMNLIHVSIKQNKTVALLMVDLDNFKQINDQYGHIQGDKVLVSVSYTMSNELDDDDLLARYGGDEFCIALMMDSTSDIKLFVAALHKKLQGLKLNVNDEAIDISVTIGASIIDIQQNMAPPEALVKKADDLLIKAKNHNKGQVMW
jgi:diguanylate cyclase (GGDEF)-like protein